MRFSRHCYDKPHRCPGWAGGGFRHAKVYRCDGGRLLMGDYDSWLWSWRFDRCDTCDVVAWPLVTRWLDPSWIRWRLERRGLLRPRPAREHLVGHDPVWRPADLPVDAAGNTRPGYECVHLLENGNGQCGSNTFDPEEADGQHHCWVPD